MEGGLPPVYIMSLCKLRLLSAAVRKIWFSTGGKLRGGANRRDGYHAREPLRSSRDGSRASAAAIA
jgi:hypothetical protein